MIKEVQLVLQQYAQALAVSQNIDKQHPAVRALLRIRDELRDTDEIRNNGNLKVEASCGKGSYTKVPWVAVFDRRITESAMQGVYPVILFKADMSGVYFSLSVASGEMIRNFKQEEAWQTR